MPWERPSSELGVKDSSGSSTAVTWGQPEDTAVRPQLQLCSKATPELEQALGSPHAALRVGSAVPGRRQLLLQEFLDLVDIGLHFPIEGHERGVGAWGQVLQVRRFSGKEKAFKSPSPSF